MRKNFTTPILVIACLLFSAVTSFAQAPTGGPYVTPRLELNKFFLLGTTGVTTNSSTSIVGDGFVGSSKAINVAGNGNIGGGMYSSGTITLGSGVLTGNVQAENLYNIATGFTSAGTITGQVDVVGNVMLSGATINGDVEATGSITGGTVTGSRTTVARNLLDIQQLPVMPVPMVLAPGTVNVPGNNTLTPGTKYTTVGGGNAKNRTITFNGAGEYFIDAVQLGGTNKFVYNFGSDPAGRIIIRVRGGMALGKFSADYLGSAVTSVSEAAKRIYFEVQGTGTALTIENGSSQATISRWLGTVYAPNGGILIGSGTGNTEFSGAFWSGQGSTNVAGNTNTTVEIRSGVNGTFVAFEPYVAPACTNPLISIGRGNGVTGTGNTYTLACDDADQQYTLTSTPVNIPGTLTYTWEIVSVPGAIDGNFFTAPGNSSSAIIASPGTYKVTVTNGTVGCTASSTVTVTSCVRQTDVVDQTGGQVIDPTTTAYYTNLGNPFEVLPGEDPMITTKGTGTAKKLLVDLMVKAETPAQKQAALDYLNGLAGGVPKGYEQIAEFPQVSGVFITGFVLESALGEINGRTDLFNYVKATIAPQTSGAFKPKPAETPATGVIVSGGDKAMAADLIRSGYGLSGTGITIGVISDSYANLYTQTNVSEYPDVVNNDIPNDPLIAFEGNVNYDYPKNYNGLKSDEGRAMLQIVHDVAPEATLKFQTGFISEIQMAAGIVSLANRGCQVIVDDITYVGAPYFRDGVITKAINLVTPPTGTSADAKNVKYFTSAGNFASKGHEDNFSEYVGTYPTGIPTTSKIHNFGTTTPGVPSFLQQINLNSLDPATYLLVLQWDDPFYSNGETGANNDLDLYLTDITGKPIKGFNRVNSAPAIGTTPEFKSDPIEYLPFQVGGKTTINVMVVSKGGAAPSLGSLKFKFVIYRGSNVVFSRQGQSNSSYDSSTIVGHARSASVMSVAAAPYRPYSPNVKLSADIAEQFAASNGAITVESFSSSGSLGQNKPDFTAPDGVNTSVNLGISGDIESDNNEVPNRFNFYGTSAAAPHAAALSALILEAKAKYSSEAPLTNEGMKTLLKSTALQIGSGATFGGSGLINGIEALKATARPTPTITRLIVPKTNNVVNLNETITIEGFNFLPNISTVYVRDPQTTWVYDVAVNAAGTQITFKLNNYDGDPDVYVYTPPTVPALLVADGGESNRVKLLGISKQPVVVEAYVQYDKLAADGVTVEREAKFYMSGTNKINYVYYGETIPEIKYRIRVNGVVVPDAELADYGIDATVLNNTAIPNPAAPGVYFPGTYNILVELPTTIAPQFTELYTFPDPINAKLRILKTPVKIIPKTQVFNYGEAFDKFDYNYELPSDVYSEDLARVRALVEAEYEPHISKELAVLNGVTFRSDGRIVITSKQRTSTGAIVTLSRIIAQGAEDEGVAEANQNEDGVAEVNTEDGVAEVNNIITINSAMAFSNIAFMATQAAMEDGVAEVNGTDDGVAEANEAEDGVAEANAFFLDFRTLNQVLDNIDGVAEVNTVEEDGVAEVNNQEDGVAEVNSNLAGDGVAEVNSGVYSANGILIAESAPTINGITVANAVPLFNGMVVINSFSDDGVAEVNGLSEEEDGVAEANNEEGVAEVNNGSTEVNGIMVNVGIIDNDGVAEVNTTVEGVAEVNETDEGVAEVNAIEGVAEVNGSTTSASTGVSIVYYENGKIVIFQNSAGAGFEDGVAEANAEEGADGVAEVNNQIINNAEFKMSEATELMVILHSTDVTAGTISGTYKSVNAVTGITPGKMHVVIPGGFFTKNWDVTYGLGTFAVNKISATINADNVTTTYDATPKMVTATVTGLGDDPIEGGLITITYKSQSGTPDYNSTTAPTTAGVYDVKIDFSGTTDYKSATKTVTLSIAKIDPLSLTTTVEGGPFTYNASAVTATGTVTGIGGVALEPALTFTYSGTLFNTSTYNTPETAPTEAGSYSVIGSFAGNDNYNAKSSDPVVFTIERATPTVNITGNTVTYDGTAKTLTGNVTGVDDQVIAGTISITYNGLTTPPINAGTYTVVGSFAGNNNYTDNTGSATLLINKADPTLNVATPQTVQYQMNLAGTMTGTVTGVVINGTNEPITSPSLTFTYNGSSTAPTNVGTYDVVASFAGNTNYNARTLEDLTLEITNANAATVSVTVNDKTYDGALVQPSTPTFTVGVNGPSAGTPTTITYTYTGTGSTSYNSTTAPKDAGTYALVVSYSGLANYADGSSVSVPFTINKATPSIDVTTNPQTYAYDNTAKTMQGVTVNGVNGETNIAGALTLTYNGAATAINAGTYTVVANFTSSNNNYSNTVRSDLSLVITKATLTLKADDVITNNGATPTFTSTVTATPDVTGATVTYSLINSAGPVTTPLNNLSAGLYTIIPAISGGTSANYTATIIPGSLYVNPFGNQVRSIKPTLECVTDNGDGTFFANYAYTNANSVDVWIKVGEPDNYILESNPGAVLEGGKPPSIFKAGGGRFRIKFDGSKNITWIVQSFEKRQKTSSASSASSSSNKCGNNFTPVEQRQRTSLVGESIRVQDKVYPNPFAGRVMIESDLTDVTVKDIKIIDLIGREFRPLSSRKLSATRMELDLSNLVTGQYYIRINSKAGVKVFKVMRQ